VLRQADFKVELTEYVGLAVFAAFFWAALMFPLFFVISQRFAPELSLTLGLGVAGSFALLSFVYIVMYPRLIVLRKIKEMEKNLLYAIRQLTVQVKSGVPLFDALVSLSEQDYGLLSEEIKDCVKKISAGWSSSDALDDLALRNPSPYFRRTIWQLTNAMRAGVELGDVLESMLSALIAEHRVAIRSYGSQLNPLVMLYMMLGVLIPSMGVTFLFILSSFTGLPISEVLFWLVLGVLAVFQFSFIGLVKGRRPSFEV
jgi:pilus assembly protein TadC